MAMEEEELFARLRTLTVKTGKRLAPEDENVKGEFAEDNEEPMSPVARMFFEPGFGCHIVYAVGIGTRIDVDVLTSGLQSTLLRHPRFSSVPAIDKKGKVARWVRTKVNINDHTVIPDLNLAAISTSPDRVMEDYAYSLSRTAMDTSRPLWDLHILNFPTSDAAAVLLFRIHHSLGDATSITSLFVACSRKTSDLTSLSAPFTSSRRQPAPRPEPGPLTFLSWIWALLVLLWHTLVHALPVIATYAFLKDTSTPLTSTASAAQRPKRLVHRIVSLNDIKDIKDAVNCTINDVLIGVTSAALTRYIDRKYCESTGVDDKKQLPHNIRLRTPMIVNLRPKTKLRASSELMEGKNGGFKWGNLISYWIISFPICKYEDPLEYVRKGKAIADSKKKSLEAIVTFKGCSLVAKCFGTKVATALCKRMHLNTTFAFSNVVGPVEQIRFFGHPITYLAPSEYGHPHALTIHFQSYMNIMTIFLGVDESIVPDPHQLLNDFTESLKLVKEAIPTK